MSCTEVVGSGSWVGILQLSTDVWLGSLAGRLYVGTADGPKSEIDESSPIGLLPCLERRYDDVITEIRAREIELSLSSGSLVEKVPLNAIPRVAVDSRLDYWVQLALDWLADMPIDAAESELLAELAREPWATQRARHRARSLSGRERR